MSETTTTDTTTAAPKPKSWRDGLPIHPAAELFPLMSADELRELGEDIKQQPRLHEFPIAVVATKRRNGWRYELADGRNRLDAMELVGVPFRLKFSDGLCHLYFGEDALGIGICAVNVEGDPYSYVLSANVHRRHLTAEQKRHLIANLIKARPEKSNRQIAKMVDASPTTVISQRTKMEDKGDVSKLDTSIDSKGRRQPARKPHKPRSTEKAAEAAVHNRAEMTKTPAGTKLAQQQVAATTTAAEMSKKTPEAVGSNEATEERSDEWHDRDAKRGNLAALIAGCLNQLVEILEGCSRRKKIEVLKTLMERLSIGIAVFMTEPPPAGALDVPAAASTADQRRESSLADDVDFPPFLRRAPAGGERG
jgi:hypothetical protein